MASKLHKIETPEECLRLWKAGLVIDMQKEPWTSADVYKKRASLTCEDAAREFLYMAYVLVESDDDEDLQL